MLRSGSGDIASVLSMPSEFDFVALLPTQKSNGVFSISGQDINVPGSCSPKHLGFTLDSTVANFL